MRAAWPVELRGQCGEHDLRLRRLRPRADQHEWLTLRRDNASWTAPWDSTAPSGQPRSVTFGQMVRQHDREARAGRLLPFAVEVDGQLAGQLHLFGITRGALCSAAAGYWIRRNLAGRGITPYALALVIDHALGPMALHRVEVNVRPDNRASLTVVRKLGMRDEGVRRNYLHIAGAWHDHRTFALTVEDLAGERVVDRLKRLSQASL